MSPLLEKQKCTRCRHSRSNVDFQKLDGTFYKLCQSCRTCQVQRRNAQKGSKAGRAALQPLHLNTNATTRASLQLQIPLHQDVRALEEQLRRETSFAVFEDPPTQSSLTPPPGIQLQIDQNAAEQRRITADPSVILDTRGPSSSSSSEPASSGSVWGPARPVQRRRRRSSIAESTARRVRRRVTPPPPVPARTITRGAIQRARLSYMLAQMPIFPSRHNLGPMNVECSACHALHFANTKRTSRETTFFLCCGNGKISPQPIPDPPEYLLHLLKDDDTDCRTFQSRIVQYNSALAFTSCKFEQSEHVREGYQSFVIRGELYHLAGPVRAADGAIPRLAQIYIYDPEAATDYRASLMSNELDLRILRHLDEMLRAINPFIAHYRTASEVIQRNCAPNLQVVLNPQLRLITEEGSDRRRTNLPTVSEIAAVIPTEYEDSSFRDVVLYTRTNGNEQRALRKIHPSHPAYMPLAYPLLFPHGEAGWHWGKPLNPAFHPGPNNRITQRMWYRHLAFYRPHTFNILRYVRRLAQRYWVDAYAVVDQERMEYARKHQNTFRADLYRGLQDHLAADDSRAAAETGHRMILPSSYLGGDRHMRTLYQDSMALLRRYGKPSLFITMTANPSWDEITAQLPERGDAMSNPGVAATVFHLKLQALLEDIKKEFGTRVAISWTVEYQKRGLPHAHILLFLTRDDSFLDVTRIDDFIRAEIPTAEIDPDGELHRIVTQHMIHGPCGSLNPKSPCMKKASDGRWLCSKGFPKPYCESTVIAESGYPQYRRRQGTYITKKLNGTDTRLGNEWIVPYSPFLSRKYQCHINVEVCESVQAIRYIHKYVYKGDDRTTLAIETDEIKQYLEGRYIGPIQAAYNILEFPTHCEWPPVEHLAVHLPGEQAVSFPEHISSQELQTRMENARTTLLAFLEYNKANADGRHLLYHEFPEKYVYVRTTKPYYWKPRQKGFAIGRIVHLSPNKGDVFYLRLLLTKVPGPTCFEDLRTVDGQLYPTFRDACRARGLLQDDGEWVKCFEEAAEFAIGGLRHLFVIALTVGDVVQPRALWDRFKEEICEGLDYHIRRDFHPIPSDDDLHLDYGLYLIQKALAPFMKTLDAFELPSPVHAWERLTVNPVVAAASNFAPEAEEAALATNLPKLNEGQRTAYEAITSAIEGDPSHAHFFLQGPGGTGKTFLYGVLCNTYRARGDIVLCVASSGIAALLLPGGQTAHSMFGIPLECTGETICNISKQSHRAELLRRVRLIIWDEVPMQHKYNIVAVHKTLCDIRESTDLFGGVPVVFGGDFAQILPVVPQAARAGTVNACIRRAFFWPRLKILRLTQNMRLPPDAVNQRWASWIRRMSYEPALYGRIQLPPEVKWQFAAPDAFYTHVFPLRELQNPLRAADFFTNRAILAPHNDTVHATNEEILTRMPDEPYELHSIDTVDVNDDTTVHELSAEFLAAINPASVPPARLRLKLGAPTMLMRNILPREGLCNGTRGVVLAVTRMCVKFKITGGRFEGNVHAIPRIKLTTNERELPWILTRKQFPLRLCFAMTINKAQGQSLPIVGIDLRTQCFSHGQLYVAFSRVTDVERLSILWHKENTERKAENIVFPEVLDV